MNGEVNTVHNIVNFLDLVSSTLKEHWKAKKSRDKFNHLKYFWMGENVLSDIIADFLREESAEENSSRPYLSSLLRELYERDKEVKKSLTGKIPDLLWGPIEIFRERGTDTGRRIDLLIHGQDVAIGVENKSHYAQDQANQIQDYMEYLNKHYGSWSFIYLKDGLTPSEESLPKNAPLYNRCIPIDCENLLSKWIACSTGKRKDFLVELTEHIWGADDELDKKFTELFRDEKNGIEATLSAFSIIRHAECVSASMFEKLEASLEKPCSENDGNIECYGNPHEKYCGVLYTPSRWKADNNKGLSIGLEFESSWFRNMVVFIHPSSKDDIQNIWGEVKDKLPLYKKPNMNGNIIRSTLPNVYESDYKNWSEELIMEKFPDKLALVMWEIFKAVQIEWENARMRS
jgi:hypothetical protein